MELRVSIFLSASGSLSSIDAMLSYQLSIQVESVGDLSKIKKSQERHKIDWRKAREDCVPLIREQNSQVLLNILYII
jgi:hypothetical protein